MNLLITLVVGVVFGLVGGMTMTVLAIKAGYFATRNELQEFMENLTAQNNEFASQMAREFAAVDNRGDMLDSRISTLEQTPTDISDIQKSWEAHKRWSLGCWNEIMHTKNSYLTQFQVKGMLDRFLIEVGHLPSIGVKDVSLNPISNEEMIKCWTGPMGPVIEEKKEDIPSGVC